MPELMFLGTEFGLYVSFDDGETWQQFKHGYPTASTMDMAIHPRDHDLVIGTFGRAAYVIDDIRPLRALAQDGDVITTSPLTVFDIPDTYLAVTRQATGTRFMADAMYAGENRGYGAMISYWLEIPEPAESEGEQEEEKEMKNEEATIEIMDSFGNVIRTLKGPAKQGLNRTTWSLRQKGIRLDTNPFEPNNQNNDSEPAGLRILPGEYTVKVTYNGHSEENKVRVSMDPRLDINEADLRERHALYVQWQNQAEVMSQAVGRIRNAFKTLDTVGGLLDDLDEETAKALRDMIKANREKLTEIGEHFAGKQVQGIRRDPTTVVSMMFTAAGYISSGLDDPDPSVQIAMGQASDRLSTALDELNTFFSTDWAAFKDAVQEAEVSLFEDTSPLVIENNN